MLDINKLNGDLISQILEVIQSSIDNTIKTPFESRIFNPRAGSGANSMLQETVHDLIFKQKIASILKSDIERALNDLTVFINTTSNSNGDGTATLLINMEVRYQSDTYFLTYSTDVWGFLN